MSKKRLLASAIIIILGFILNICIIRYQKPLENEMVKICFSIISSEENDFQIFYLLDKQQMPEEFSAEQSVLNAYHQIDEKQDLIFEVPAVCEYIRLDFGSLSAETRILSIETQFKNEKHNIEPVFFKDPVMQNMIDAIEWEGDTMILHSQEGDPFLVWNTRGWNFIDLVQNAESATDFWGRIAVCFIVDVLLLFVLKYLRKLVFLPVELFQNRKLILSLAKNDFKTKFAGSYLGIIWAFVQPIVTVLVYWFVFEKGLHASGINTRAGITAPFVLWLIAGLVPWFFFQDALNGGTNALLEYSYLVKKVVFKISILPIVKVLSALFVHVFFLVFMLILYSAYSYYPDWYTVQILYYSFCMFILVLGLVYASCAIVGFFKDLSQIINIMLQVGIWMTPIMWNIEAIELSPLLLTVFKLNPMYYIVEGYRDALINKVWLWEKPEMTLYFWIVTVVMFGLGAMIFKRLKVHFADVL